MMNDLQSILPMKRYARIVLVVGILGWMSFYPIYTSFYKANAIEQYERHKAHMEANSMFFNPWQYRVLCPLLVEGIYQVFDATVFKPFDFSFDLKLPGGTTGKNDVTQKLVASVKNPEFVKYNIVFVFFRMVQNMVVFWLAFNYISFFVRSKSLVLLSLMTLALFMGNGVVDSDYTFNTYMDIIVYLLAGLVIVKSYNPWWILPITIVGALNRETSILIPALAFCSRVNWSNWPNLIALFFSDRKVLWVTIASYVAFAMIFVSIRWYYGYEPASTWRVPPGWPMLKLNLFSAASLKTYMELFGIFGFLPFWSILVLKRSQKLLRIFFWTLVPVWFCIHISTAIGFQTRLFLVPVVLVFIPVVFDFIDRGLAATNSTISQKLNT